MSARYEIQKSEKLGRYLVAAKNLKAGETILSDQPFVVGPNSDTSLVCFNCYLPLISKFLICKNCAVAPICPGDGCPDQLAAWHNEAECDFFRNLKLEKGLSPMTMVQNVGSLLVLRALLKKNTHPETWEEFMQLETHLEERRDTSVWQYYENTVKFISSLGLLQGEEDINLVQKVCAVIDVNSFEVRGPPIPAIGCAEVLRGVYLKAALLAHDCIANTHIAINDNNVLICHASINIKKGEIIYYNYSDPLKGTLLRQQHLLVGKYFKCTCTRCSDPTEMGTYMSSAICPDCKTAYISCSNNITWSCHMCKKEYEKDSIDFKVKCCSDKLEVINKKDEKELEEYIKYVSMVLAPHHYLLLDAKQRLAGVLRDTINREPRPTKKMMRRKIELCQELLPVLEKISPGICRTKGKLTLNTKKNIRNIIFEGQLKVFTNSNVCLNCEQYIFAITLFELHITMVQLAKKLFDGREITASAYMDELVAAEKHLKRALEMLLIEPGNSPEGELCAKSLELYRSLKNTMGSVLDGIHADGKTYDCVTEREIQESERLNDVD